MTDTRRDVSWTVVFRLDRTGNWVDWSTGHRSSAEAVRESEVLASVPSVAEIRFDCVTVQRERHSLHDLAVIDHVEPTTSKES